VAETVALVRLLITMQKEISFADEGIDSYDEETGLLKPGAPVLTQLEAQLIAAEERALMKRFCLNDKIPSSIFSALPALLERIEKLRSGSPQATPRSS